MRDGSGSLVAVRVAIATIRPLPEPDPDEPLLLHALAEAGATGVVVPWGDADAEWASFHRVVLRSTWDYHLRHEAFLDWVDRTAGVAPLLNAPDLVRWNVHKGYLLELARRGFPVVPTRLLERGSAPALADVMDSEGWGEVVVKPAVSCASFETLRVSRDLAGTGQEHLDRLLPARDIADDAGWTLAAEGAGTAPGAGVSAAGAGPTPGVAAGGARGAGIAGTGVARRTGVAGADAARAAGAGALPTLVLARFLRSCDSSLFFNACTGSTAAGRTAMGPAIG